MDEKSVYRNEFSDLMTTIRGLGFLGGHFERAERKLSSGEPAALLEQQTLQHIYLGSN